MLLLPAEEGILTLTISYAILLASSRTRPPLFPLTDTLNNRRLVLTEIPRICTYSCGATDATSILGRLSGEDGVVEGLVSSRSSASLLCCSAVGGFAVCSSVRRRGVRSLGFYPNMQYQPGCRLETYAKRQWEITPKLPICPGTSSRLPNSPFFTSSPASPDMGFIGGRSNAGELVILGIKILFSSS